MLILGIESSCDETAAAVVRDGRTVLSNVIASQIDIHSRFGGVVPEIASRQHIGAILPVVRSALREAAVGLETLDAIAVTAGPGLVGSLLVGLNAAKGLAMAAGLPLYPVHHIAGHIAANYLVCPELEPPFLCLVVSGGHSHIVRVSGRASFDVLARTRDDAAGEAFDKVARAAGLGYPGGPAIDRASAGGNPRAIRFPETDFGADNLDFSFSGVKTAALSYLNHLDQQAAKSGCSREQILNLPDFAASFQNAVTGVLAGHLMRAAARYPGEPVALAGGVASNRTLRERIQTACAAAGRMFCCPPPILCTDNAAMIAAMGDWMAQAGCLPADDGLDASASLDIALWHREQLAEAGLCA